MKNTFLCFLLLQFSLLSFVYNSFSLWFFLSLLIEKTEITEITEITMFCIHIISVPLRLICSSTTPTIIKQAKYEYSLYDSISCNHQHQWYLLPRRYYQISGKSHAVWCSSIATSHNVMTVELKHTMLILPPIPRQHILSCLSPTSRSSRFLRL